MIMNALNGVKSDYHPERITKADKDFFKKFDLKDLRYSQKLKLNIFTKLIKRLTPTALVFLVMKIRKNIQFMYQKMLRRKRC